MCPTSFTMTPSSVKPLHRKSRTFGDANHCRLKASATITTSAIHMLDEDRPGHHEYHNQATARWFDVEAFDFLGLLILGFGLEIGVDVDEIMWLNSWFWTINLNSRGWSSTISMDTCLRNLRIFVALEWIIIQLQGQTYKQATRLCSNHIYSVSVMGI